jgi:uracil phosphoribosyltransferase
VANHYPNVEFWVGGCDPTTDPKGWIRPGMGDVGDRLFLTIGKH